MTSGSFRRGQHVTVEIDGKEVGGTFFRQAAPRDGIDAEEVPGGDITAVGWVQRVDTDEIEGFLLSDIAPTAEADVRISIGKPYEVMQDERRAATEAYAEALRATGITVDLEIIEREQGVYGLGPIEWTAIFIGTTVATSLITNLTNDIYEKAKQLLLDRKAKGGRPNKGFVIYGPDGKELRRWDGQNGDHDPKDEG
jgi:hypothetical protein